MRVSGANGARNPNNKGENMPRRQNVTSGLINSQDFRIHRPTHFVYRYYYFFTYNYLFYFIGNSIQILAVKFLDFHSYLRVYTFQFKKEKRRKEELFESLGKVSKRKKKGNKNWRRKKKKEGRKEVRKEGRQGVPCRCRSLWCCFRGGEDRAESFTAIAVTASP